MTEHENPPEAESAPENESGLWENETYIQGSAAAPTNAAESTKTIGPSALTAHKNSQTGTTYFTEVFDVSGATDV